MTDVYERTGYMGEHNMKENTQTRGRARNMKKKNKSGIEGTIQISRYSNRY